MTKPPYRDSSRRQNRRDPLLLALQWLSVTGWLILLAALLVLAEARPPVETFFERWYDIRLRSGWDLNLARYIFYLMLLGLATSLTGLAINSRRLRRKGDEWRVSLLLVAVISLLGLIRYLTSF
jgi:uncharacterized membrane protein YhaH (DUF805 family)